MAKTVQQAQADLDAAQATLDALHKQFSDAKLALQMAGRDLRQAKEAEAAERERQRRRDIDKARRDA